MRLLPVPVLLALVAMAGLQMGATFSCGPQRSIEIISPAAGVVGTCDLEIQFALVGTFDLATLQANLNGQKLIVNGDGPIYSVRVDPGAPLQIDVTNQITVQANRLSDGVPVIANRSFDYIPPPASARVITSVGELIEGPLAHGQLGDYLLENGCARFVVQKPGLRDFNQVGAYGGNLIDAEIVQGGVPKGNDNFWELQPAVNIESVVNAQTAQVVNDGVDGNPAVVETCGPDDLLDGINPSTAAVDAGGAPLAPSIDDKDYDVTGCTAYALARGKRYVALTTTIENNETSALPLFVGDYVSGAGELEQWTPLSVGAFFSQSGVGEMLVNFATDALTYYGFDAAEGVDYALVPSKPGPAFGRSSSFSVTGVSYVLNHYSIPLALFGGIPDFVVPAQVLGVPGTNSFTRYFAVGDGSASNAVAVQIEKEGIAAGNLQVCVTEADGNQTPIPGARVVAAQNSSGGTTVANVLRGHWVAGADGCVDGRLPAGNYLIAAGKEGYPYQGGGSVPATTLVTVPTNGAVRQDIVLPETGRLRVEVVDETGAPMPGRVAVVGFDPSPERLLTTTVAVIGTINTALIYDQADAIPRGLSRTEYANGSGILEMELEPGDYQIAVSRGNEYALHKEDVTVGAGGLVTVNAKLVRVLDTPGFISSDYHVHMIDSPDSRISKGNRVLSMAGEGVENIIATDHSVITNLASTIADLAVGPFVHSTPGEEITSFDTGHYNAYPQGLDPTRVQTHGSTDWAGAAPPGQDFPSFGNYILVPAEIENLALTDPDNAGLDTVVQINHIGSQFSPLKINTALVPPASVLAPGDAAKYRLDPGVANFFHNFPALELWNGMNVAHQNEFLLERIGIWMNLLNQGFMTTAISDTDTHDFHNLRSGGARTWTPSSTDAPAAINDNEIGLAVKDGKAVGGQGIFVLTRLVADSTGETTGFELGDQTIDVTVPVVPPKVVQRPGVRTTDNEVHLDIDIQAPAWAPYDRIEIYSNAATTVAASNGGVPVLFGAVPDITLNLGAGDFTRTVVDKSPPGPPIPGATRFETQKRVTFSGLTEDAWIAVVVKGTLNNSPPMFPVHPSDLSTAQNPTLAALKTVSASENGVRALGMTNALFVDMDGNPGFDPPITP